SHHCSFRQMLLEDLARVNVVPRIALETSSKEILKQFAANELGMAFMPDMAAQEEVGKGRLRKMDWQGEDFPVYAQVFVHKDKHISKALEALVNLISEGVYVS
ncbi:MAG: substrate-binding domain-containing protein, partial [Oscillospiraceae bacterium]|nr:substrate-binding domain-containing protein [Oscillospiraceae bacterium]